MPGVNFIRVRELCPLDQVLDLIGWTPNFLTPSERRGRCPLHTSSSKNPRSFDVDGESWYCHKCKIGGGSIELYAAVYRVNVHQAAIKLCNALGVPVPWGTTPGTLRPGRYPHRKSPDQRRGSVGGAGATAPAEVSRFWVCLVCGRQNPAEESSKYCGQCGTPRGRTRLTRTVEE